MSSSSHYLKLVYKLSGLLHGPLSSIEILPGGIEEWVSMELPIDAPKLSSDFPFVFVEGNLGIPKKVIYALYLAATGISWRSSNPQDAIAATAVILVLNSAHQTALNTRKSLIQRGHLEAENELLFTELLVRGLTDCAKQSIVWDHRRWCFKKIYGTIGPSVSTVALHHWATSEEAHSFPKITPAAIRNELEIIHHTCETYPRNYHSWVHWHWTVDVTLSSSCLDDGDVQRDFLQILVEAYVRLRTWVDRHPSDYSAMHQLCQIQQIIDHLRPTGLPTGDIPQDLPSPSLVNQSLELLTAYPTHESLWMYLRVVIGKLSVDEQSIVLGQMKFEPSSNHHASQLYAWFARGRVEGK